MSAFGDPFDENVCWVCGCTDLAACVGGCNWIADPTETGDLCSRCHALALALVEVRKQLRTARRLTADELAQLTGIAALPIAIDDDGRCILDELVDHDHLTVDRQLIPARYMLANPQENHR